MLERIRVLDLSDETGHAAGRILADLGARVVKVEPPGGDPVRRRGPFVGGFAHEERGVRWIVGNAGKQSVVLDLESRGGRAGLLDLVQGTDVLLDSHPPGWREEHGLSDERLRQAEPGLVVASITPFGRTGPGAGRVGGDLVVVAMGGNASMTGRPDGPPLRCSLPTSSMHAAPEAVVGILLALLDREETGWGQSVDVSMQECQVTGLLSGPGQLALGGRAGRRMGPRLGRTREIWAARDGWISFGLRGGPARVPNLVATVELMDERGLAPEWLREFDWSAWNPATADEADIARLEEAFGAFFRMHSMRELYEEALARRILLAPCNDGREVLDHPQLRSRSLFAGIPVEGRSEAVEIPARFAAWQGEGGAIGVRGGAPRLAAHQHEVLGDARRHSRRSSPAGPEPAAREPGTLLAGLKILELGSGAAGPVATRYFAEQGAQIVRIESSLRPDFLRFLQPDGLRGLDRSPMFALLNADKRSLLLDMKRDEGREIFERLVGWADVVTENFAPGVLERWGIDVESLCRRHPRLVFVRSCLFGQTGPQRGYPGFGGQGSAIAGFNHLTGEADGEAVGPYATITDSLTPRFVGAVIAAALWRRGRTGRGGLVDASQIEAGVYSLGEMVARESAGCTPACRMGNRSEWWAPHGIYPCAGQDRWVAIAVRDEHAWRALANEMEADGCEIPAAWAAREVRLEQVDALDGAIRGWTSDRDAGVLMERLQKRGVEAGVVQGFGDLLRDPQLGWREHFAPVGHAELGEVLCERPGYRLERAPGRIRSAGPKLGAHGREVLREVLGASDEEIDALEAGEVLR
ncbi:MAG: CaiB/BaiF CoA transferase family protein [Myxococcota bacterium]